MSIQVMSAVWKMSLPDSEKLIMLALADWSNDEGQCWPSIFKLVEKSSKGERTVQGALKSLEAKGALSRIMKPGKGTIYTLHPRSGCTPAAAAPPQRTTQTPAAAAPNTLRTTNSLDTDVSKQRGRGTAKPALPDWIPVEQWNGWVSSRKVKPSARAVKLAIAKLEKLRRDGHDPGLVLDQSALSGWPGLYKLKDNRNGRQPDTLRGTRPDPAIDAIRTAQRAIAERNAGSVASDWRDVRALPAY